MWECISPFGWGDRCSYSDYFLTLLFPARLLSKEDTLLPDLNPPQKVILVPAIVQALLDSWVVLGRLSLVVAGLYWTGITLELLMDLFCSDILERSSSSLGVIAMELVYLSYVFCLSRSDDLIYYSSCKNTVDFALFKLVPDSCVFPESFICFFYFVMFIFSGFLASWFSWVSNCWGQFFCWRDYQR